MQHRRLPPRSAAQLSRASRWGGDLPAHQVGRHFAVGCVTGLFGVSATDRSMNRVTARSRPVASRKRPVRKPRQMAGHRREIAIPWDTCCMHRWTAERERRSSMRMGAMPSTTVLPKGRSSRQLGSAHRVGRKLLRLTVHVHACGMPAVPHVVKSTTWGIFGSGGRGRIARLTPPKINGFRSEYLHRLRMCENLCHRV